MKKILKDSYFIFTLLILGAILSGCVSNKNEESTNNSIESSSNSESIEESTIEDANDVSSEETVSNDLASTSSEKNELNISDKDVKETLSQYSSEQIEYARVWLQLGANQDIDELHVQHISAGTQLNPNDNTSLNFPEDVIQLAGSRLVDGSVTYSGNGDGTINVYNVPLRWDGKYPAGEGFYLDIIEATKLETIDPGKEELVIEIIELLNIN